MAYGLLLELSAGLLCSARMYIGNAASPRPCSSECTAWGEGNPTQYFSTPLLDSRAPLAGLRNDGNCFCALKEQEVVDLNTRTLTSVTIASFRARQARIGPSLSTSAASGFWLVANIPVDVRSAHAMNVLYRPHDHRDHVKRTGFSKDYLPRWTKSNRYSSVQNPIYTNLAAPSRYAVVPGRIMGDKFLKMHRCLFESTRDRQAIYCLTKPLKNIHAKECQKK
jgi:hypothetical protein